MTVVDVIVIFVIFLSALFGIWRGFVREAISLAKWVLASWIAITFAPKLAVILPIESEAWSLGAAFANVLYLCVYYWHSREPPGGAIREKNRSFRSRSGVWFAVWFFTRWGYYYRIRRNRPESGFTQSALVAGINHVDAF